MLNLVDYYSLLRLVKLETNVVISLINELRKVPLQRLYLPQSTV